MGSREFRGRDDELYLSLAARIGRRSGLNGAVGDGDGDGGGSGGTDGDRDRFMNDYNDSRRR